MNDTLIIFLGATKKQETFWKYYHKHPAGRNHDIMVAYIDRSIIPEIRNTTGTVVYENKIVNGKDIPHRAFGAYRYFFNKYKDSYKYFAFISDDVIIRCDNWLEKSIAPLTRYPLLGWTATQIYSEKASRCFPDHLRAPIWFAKGEALAKVRWNFNNDHDGEVRIADQFLRAGYFGIQVGHKIDLAYDSLENGGLGIGDGITSSFEKKFFSNKNLLDEFTEEEIAEFDKKLWDSIVGGDISSWTATSPHPHIQTKNFINELQGLDGQIYTPSLSIARKNAEVLEHKEYNIQILKEYAPKDKAIPLHVHKPKTFKENVVSLWPTKRNS